MSLGSALTNQIVGAVAKQATGNLASVLGSPKNAGNSSDTSAMHKGNTGQGGMNLSYPLNVEGDEQQGHYVMFMINVAKQGSISASKGKELVATPPATGRAPRSSSGGSFSSKNFISTQLNANSPDPSTSSTMAGRPPASLSFDRPPTVKLGKAITLYMPPSVAVQYKANYKDDPISKMAETITQSGEQIIKAFTQGQGDWIDKSVKAFQGGGKKVAEGGALMLADLGASALDTAAPGIKTIAQIKSGAIIGSRTEMMFTDVQRREFSFEFNFIPKSLKESNVVDEIVYTFKKHMLPSMASNINVFGADVPLGMGRVLTIPDTFDIHYFYQNDENPYLNRISTCYLTGCDVAYGDAKYTTYEPTNHPTKGAIGPPPQKTNIKLAFREIETITRERIEQGF